MGAWRLAASALDFRKWRATAGAAPPVHDSRDQQMENDRQSAAHAFSAGDVSDIGCWMADVTAIALDVYAFHFADDFNSSAHSFFAWLGPATRRNFQAKPLPRRLVGPFTRALTYRTNYHVSGLPGMAHVRCNSAHTCAPVRHAQEFVGVGHRGPGQVCGGPETPGDLPKNGWRSVVCRGSLRRCEYWTPPGDAC